MNGPGWEDRKDVSAMSDLNICAFTGRLARDPELKYTANGKAVCNFTLAVGRRVRDEADFIDFVVWEKQAEAFSQYLKKGVRVAVSGRATTRSYETSEGQKRKVFEVVVAGWHFADAKRDRVDAEDEGAGEDEGLPF
jgi:single-strand DNA-binding protein